MYSDYYIYSNRIFMTVAIFQGDGADSCVDTPSGSIDSVLSPEEYQTWRSKVRLVVIEKKMWKIS